MSYIETHTKRQAIQHGCLPSLLGDGDKGIEKVYSEEKIILYCPAKAEQKSLVPLRKAKQATKEGPHLFVLFESPFTTVSTVGRGNSFLVSLVL